MGELNSFPESDRSRYGFTLHKSVFESSVSLINLFENMAYLTLSVDRCVIVVSIMVAVS